MTDQMPKLAIGDKLLFSALTWKDVSGEASYSAQPQWFDRWLWLHYKEDRDHSLTLASVTVCHRTFCVFPEILHPYIIYPPQDIWYPPNTQHISSYFESLPIMYVNQSITNLRECTQPMSSYKESIHGDTTTVFPSLCGPSPPHIMHHF